MPTQTIAIIRHGEKPKVLDDGTVVPPFTALAAADTGRDNLSPRGWQRAGALVRFFAPRGGDHDRRPAAIFAARTSAAFPSLRTQQTVAPLAAFLGLTVALPAAPDGVDAAAAAILAAAGPCLVAWEHKNIAKLVAALTGDSGLAPHWSGGRFDMVLMLERQDGAWSLAQVPQRLLAGDDRTPLRPRRPGEDR